MKRFVGDLSDADAELIEVYASRARRVLEFGAGGSTQIIAQSLPPAGKLTSLETDPEWIRITSERLGKLRVRERVDLVPYSQWQPSGQYDLIFDDGVDELRLPFARRAWPLLGIGGVLLFHDTRRAHDVANVLELVRSVFEEVDVVCMNEAIGGRRSNLTAVRKKSRDAYVNWTQTEGKPRWRYSLEPVPESFWR